MIEERGQVFHQRERGEIPERSLDQALATFPTHGVFTLWLAVEWQLRQYWLEGEPALPLMALFCIKREGARLAIAFHLAPRTTELTDVVAKEGDWFSQLGVAGLMLGQPFTLDPVIIPKPWGREIWFTGIERRGVAGVRSDPAVTPLPWLLAALPQRLGAGQERDLILLKILDPLPEPVFGDLYFELHQEKREVYVVTRIDPQAWPDGVGAIRYGFDQARLAGYESPAMFLDHYLEAVKSYRAVRETIDARLDRFRAEEGTGPNEPVDASTLQRWLSMLPEEIVTEEAGRRAAMEQFTAMRPLRVGDVVKVPHRVPHSLQHGVRTVEFQTPVYERLILSFAQKVLTQAGWDTDQAAQVLELSAPPEDPFEQMAAGEGWREERIVEFDDFEVRRVALQAGACYALARPQRYALLMAVGGALDLDGLTVAADAALLLPKCWRGGSLRNASVDPRVALLAAPRLRH